MKKLEKLTPAEKIKRLRQLEEENRKEIEEAEKLVKEIQSGVEREKIAEGVEVPGTKPIDIGRLFKEEEGLETTVKKEAPSAEEEESALYQLAQGYEEAKEILYGGEPLDEEKLARVDRLGERIEKARYTTTSKDLANLAVATRSLIYKIRKYQQQEDRFL